MKYKTIILLLTCITAITVANAEQLKNGDFESGSTGWKGDKRVTQESPENDNKVCRIKVDNDDQEFYQTIKVKKAKDIYFSFSAKISEDYEGRGISIRFTRENGSYTFYDRSIDSTEWSKIEIKFSDIRSEELKVSIIVRSGEEGYMDFDNFDLVAE